MESSSFGNPAKVTGQRGPNPVTGAATIQPGTFREPDQPSPNRTSSWINPVLEGVGNVANWIEQYPIAAFFIGAGLGAALASTFVLRGRFE